MRGEYPFAQVDVFTDRVFGGNALAVFFEAAGLSDDEMQAIAREMNLSETTFVLPARRPDCAARVRIFTPGRELPFAGHPTLGTAWVLARRAIIPTGTTRFALEEGIGPVPVSLDGDAFVWMGQQDPVFGPPVPHRGAVAHALGLGEADLLAGAPIQPGSAGVEFLYVPLRDREAVDRAALDPRALAAGLDDAGRMAVFVFAVESAPSGGRAYSRMFAPHFGIPEDPASGSASGPLGVYLVRHGLVPAAGDRGDVLIVSEQGTKMGRQSFLHVRLRVRGGLIGDIEVGGGVVPVLEGRLIHFSTAIHTTKIARPDAG